MAGINLSQILRSDKFFNLLNIKWKNRRCLLISVFVSNVQGQVAEKGRELKELKDTFALVVKEKEKLEVVSDNFYTGFYRLL